MPELCRWCGGEADPATTCPKSITCPKCGAGPGSSCRRPSGHRAMALHSSRVKTAEQLDTMAEPVRRRAGWTPGDEPLPGFETVEEWTMGRDYGAWRFRNATPAADVADAILATPAVRAGLQLDERRCYCPGDCGCWPHNSRPNVCGCKQHDPEENAARAEWGVAVPIEPEPAPPPMAWHATANHVVGVGPVLTLDGITVSLSRMDAAGTAEHGLPYVYVNTHEHDRERPGELLRDGSPALQVDLNDATLYEALAGAGEPITLAVPGLPLGPGHGDMARVVRGLMKQLAAVKDAADEESGLAETRAEIIACSDAATAIDSALDLLDSAVRSLEGDA